VRVKAYLRLVRRISVRALSLYLLFAMTGRFGEEMGAVSCGCRPDCWCKKPIPSTVRWVFPYGHRLYSAEGKAGLDSD
jgi:hypothetical protein